MADSTRVAALARLTLGAWVRGTTVPGERFSGIVRRAGPDTLVVVDAGREWALPGAAVATLWEAEGRQTSEGALGGAVAAGALGGGLGLLFGSFMCEGNCGGARLQGGVFGAAAGAAVGALIGAAVGSLVPRWHRRFP